MTVLVTLLGVVVALLVVLVAGLLRSHAEILRSLHDLGVDLDPDAPASRRTTTSQGDVTQLTPARRESRTAADLSGVTPSRDALSIAVVGARHPTLIAFLTSGCSTCSAFWSAFADGPSPAPPGDARLVVVTKGEEAESPGRLRKFAPPSVPVVMSSDAWTDYDVPVAPYFVFVDGPTGEVVGEGAANTWPQLVDMMSQAIADAGIDLRTNRRRGADGRAREVRADRDLLASGIEPGHPSLYPQSERDLVEDDAGT
jgi:hypothetical protein